jgi:hypothetical protein
VTFTEEESRAHSVRNQLKNDDVVIFSHVEGMTELNNGRPYKVKKLNGNQISIGDTTSFQPYLRGGYLRQLKTLQHISFVIFSISMAVMVVLTGFFFRIIWSNRSVIQNSLLSPTGMMMTIPFPFTLVSLLWLISVRLLEEYQALVKRFGRKLTFFFPKNDTQ